MLSTSPATVNSPQGLNLRASPEISPDNVIGTIPNGAAVSVTNIVRVKPDRTWLFLLGAYTGWCAAEFLASPKPVPPVIVPPTPSSNTRNVGLHLMGTLSPTDIQEAINLKAGIYKSVSNMGALQTVHQGVPDAVCIYRHYLPDDWNVVIDQRGIGGALDEWFSRLQYALDGMPWAWFESANEIGASDKYLEFERQRVERLALTGHKACVINLATGNSDTALWGRAKAMIDAVIRHDGLIGTHGYAQSVMSANYGTSKFNASGAWEGDLFPTAKSDQAWTALKVIRDIADVTAQGQGAVRWAITEMGLDDLVQKNNGIYYPLGIKTRGWKTCADVWQKLGWLNGRTAAQFYRQQLDWWGQTVAAYPQIVGGTVFTFGTDTPDWAPFDVREVY